MLPQALERRWGIADEGLNYNVVAVFGSQSTGKSTLLNRLFQTGFDVMDESIRQQTTHGIWISKARGCNTLVMDVEGTDGRERGEDQDFERKSALFSLSVAEVLIVNMWEQSVGLYNGANMGLLKTVMEVNLQLFQRQGSPKTCMFFVLRDFTGRTPLQKLADTLINDLKRIWEGLIKPTGMESARITDFFDFEYIGVPHKIYASEGFEAKVEMLRERFYNKSDPGYIFKPFYHKRIPIDGFPHFAESVWEQIVNNRDLDLPTQQELLAQFRCDEISKVIYERFVADVKPLRYKLDTGNVVADLGPTMQSLTQSCLDAFDKDASRYNAAVYKTKRGEFSHQMYTALSVLFVQQLRNLHKQAILLFDDLINASLKADSADFAKKMKQAAAEAEALFKNGATSAVIPVAGWAFDEQLSLFQEELAQECTKKRAEAMDRLTKKLDSDIATLLKHPVKDLFSKPSKYLWDDVLKTFNKVSRSVSTTLSDSLYGFDATPQVVKDEVIKMKVHVWDILIETIQGEIGEKQLADKLRKRFESKFRYDDSGIPRFWSPTDNIDAIFGLASSQAEDLLLLLSAFRVEISDIDKDVVEAKEIHEVPIVLISLADQEEARISFNREAHNQFMEAKRSTVATTARIPPWFIMMTIALGWNELMTVLWNPVLTALLALTLLIAYGIWRTNLAGPLFQVARVATGEVRRQVSDNMRDRGLTFENLMSHPTIAQARESISSSFRSLNGTAASGSDEHEMYDLSKRSTRPATAPAASTATTTTSSAAAATTTTTTSSSFSSKSEPGFSPTGSGVFANQTANGNVTPVTYSAVRRIKKKKE
eukprot:jgi/Hompol1/4225/HPOL_003520-RA